MRLRDLWADPPDRLTHRELIAYVRHLPPHESALGRALLGPAAAYDPHMHRLTDIAEQVQWVSYHTMAAAGGKPKKPKPIRRPRVPET